MTLSIFAVEGIPEIRHGDDIATMIAERMNLQDGDIVVVTSKIVSKAAGRSVQATDREDAITSQTVRVVATRGNTRIVENPLGLVLAAAGVDSSNTPEGTVLLLPEDPDASARDSQSPRGNIGVIISDTTGRPWRQGVTDIAIGAAGIHVLEDLRGAHYVTFEDGPGVASMIRPLEEDMFRLGTNEAWDEGYRAGPQAGEH